MKLFPSTHCALACLRDVPCRWRARFSRTKIYAKVRSKISPQVSKSLLFREKICSVVPFVFKKLLYHSAIRQQVNGVSGFAYYLHFWLQLLFAPLLSSCNFVYCVIQRYSGINLPWNVHCSLEAILLSYFMILSKSEKYWTNIRFGVSNENWTWLLGQRAGTKYFITWIYKYS